MNEHIIHVIITDFIKTLIQYIIHILIYEYFMEDWPYLINEFVIVNNKVRRVSESNLQFIIQNNLLLYLLTFVSLKQIIDLVNLWILGIP